MSGLNEEPPFRDQRSTLEAVSPALPRRTDPFIPVIDKVKSLEQALTHTLGNSG